MSFRSMCSCAPNRGSVRARCVRRSAALLSLASAALALGLGLGACTSARNALGTNTSPCYQALPVAEDAVYDRGSFAGVRLVRAKELATREHLLEALKERAAGVKDVCVVGYRGSFRQSEVKMPIGRPPAGGLGRYAVVVVARSTNRLLGTIVRLEPPVRFWHVALDERR